MLPEEPDESAENRMHENERDQCGDAEPAVEKRARKSVIGKKVHDDPGGPENRQEPGDPPECRVNVLCETVNRIRCVRTGQFKYIRNFMPERPYTQKNEYKETSYPMLNLMKELHAEGKLTPVQALFMAPRKPDEELFDLRSDPWEINNLAGSPDHRKTLKRLRAILEKWIKDSGDQGRFPEQDSSITPRDRERIRQQQEQPRQTLDSTPRKS